MKRDSMKELEGNLSAAFRVGALIVQTILKLYCNWDSACEGLFHTHRFIVNHYGFLTMCQR